MDLSQALPNTHTRQPPGMTWDDYQAWQHWIKGPGRAWPQYAYDVELFTQGLLPRETDPAMLKLWARNTAKRIDAVGIRDNVFTLFETRRFTGWSAIAQLKGYEMLWRFSFPALPLAGLWIITEKIEDTIRASAATQGVRVWVVGEDFRP